MALAARWDSETLLHLGLAPEFRDSNLRETCTGYLKNIDRKFNSLKTRLSFIFFRLGGQTATAGSEIAVGLAI